MPVLFLLALTLLGTPLVNWFNLTLLDWAILIAAVAIAAYLMHAKPLYIAIGCLALLGIGIIMSVSKAKPRI